MKYCGVCDMNDKLKNNKLDNSILEKAKTKEEKKRLIEDAGMELSAEEAKKILKDAGLELTDAELDQVAGGLPRKITRV